MYVSIYKRSHRICKSIKKKAREDTRKHNLREIRQTIAASIKSLKNVRRTDSLALGKNRMITLLDKQVTEIHEQDKTGAWWPNGLER